MISIIPNAKQESGIMMKTKDPHWTFYAAILSRSLKDLETASSAPPGRADDKFYRAESPNIIEEAREALTALEGFLRAYDQTTAPPNLSSTRH